MQTHLVAKKLILLPRKMIFSALNSRLKWKDIWLTQHISLLCDKSKSTGNMFRYFLSILGWGWWEERKIIIHRQEGAESNILLGHIDKEYWKQDSPGFFLALDTKEMFTSCRKRRYPHVPPPNPHADWEMYMWRIGILNPCFSIVAFPYYLVISTCPHYLSVDQIWNLSFQEADS